MAIWNRVQSLIFGGAVGAAASDAISPQLEPARQHAWSRNKVKVLDPATAARLVAQALVDLAVAEDEAGRNGVNANRLEALVQLAQVAPPHTEAQDLRRRGRITREQLIHSFAKEQIEPQYWDALADLVDERLPPAVVAVAIQRGIMPAPFPLPVSPPTATGKVPAFPVSPLDPLEETRAAGIGSDRLFVETAIVGNPMAPDQAAQATFRGIIERADFDRAIAEGNTRNEWRDAIFDYFRQIPSAIDYVQARLRGWTDDAGMYAGAGRHGMSQADTDLLFKIHGRPLSWHQVWIGLQRGGEYDGPIADLDPAFLHALRQSDIRPEWYNLAWHSRYSEPSPFVVRSLTQDGTFTEAEADEDLRFIGWEPAKAAKAAAFWASKAGATATNDPHVSKADTQLWGTLHKSYVAGETSSGTASATLGTLGVQDIAGVLSRWDAERALIRAQLSAKEVVKAWYEQVLNPATGVAWTRQDALDALAQRGYSLDDANTLLEE